MNQPNVVVCATCGRLRANKPETRCGCQPPNEELSAEARIPSRLCAICGLTIVGAVGRWTRLLCVPCMRDAQALNQAAGRLVVPIGVHSLMNGVSMTADIDDDATIQRFAANLRTLNIGIAELQERGAAVVLQRCHDLGVVPVEGVVPISSYLEACTQAGITRELAMADFVATLEDPP